MKFTKEELEQLGAASEYLDPDELDAIRDDVVQRKNRERAAEQIAAIFSRAMDRE